MPVLPFSLGNGTDDRKKSNRLLNKIRINLKTVTGATNDEWVIFKLYTPF